MPLRAFRARLEQKLQQTADAAREQIPAANLRDQLLPANLGPRGDTGQGYTPDPDAVTRIDVRKNSTGTVYSRRRLNLIEGSGVTVAVADDGANEEIDIMLSAAGGGGAALTIEELDGTPTESAPTKLIFPNGTLAVASHEVTYTPAAASSSAVTTGSSAAIIPGLAGSADRAGIGGAGTSEEYDTGSSGLTWTNAPATENSNSTIPSHLYLSFTATVESLGYAAWAPAGDFDIRAPVMIGVSGSLAVMGLIVMDSSNANRLFVQINTNSGGVAQAFTYAGGVLTQVGSNLAWLPRQTYLRITRVGTTITYYVSERGLLWQKIASGTFAITVARRGYRIDNAGTNDYASDWLRTDV